MKLSLNWLQDFLTLTERDPKKLADLVTAHVAEVDDVEMQGTLLDRCCVGAVVSIDPHPNADKLRLCRVRTDHGDKKVVCGGTNLRVGMRVAFAHIGANVKWHGGDMMTLEKVKIRGEESEGMICAAEELGLEDHVKTTPEQGERPIADLGDGDVKVGEPLRAFFGMNDVILHIDNHAITHRADLFSHVGFARELVAIGAAKWKEKPAFKASKFPKNPVPFKFEIHEKKLMPRYCACMIEIEGLGETPDFMKERIASVGWRSINLPIDITNFVASEVGVPLHSFDADDIKGTVHMRTSKKGETIVTLDKQTRALPDGALILSDDAGVFDLLGIMGGLRSSTKSSTRRIYLHSCSLDPASIRSTVIATGHRTDAATVYEKGVPHVTTEEGFLRAVELFLKYVPGARLVSRMESFGDNGKGKPIAMSVARVNSALGTELSAKQMKSILESLECSVAGSGDALKVTPPLHRLKDLTGAHDLAEEVGRVYGYIRIEPVMPSANVAIPARDARVHRMRGDLVSQGYLELLPLSLLGPDILRDCGFDASLVPAIANPIGKEVSLMTPSTLPALLMHAETYLRNETQTLRTFHVSKVFAGKADAHRELGALVAAKTKAALSCDPFLLLKSELLSALARAGYHGSIDRCDAAVPPYAHPGRVASVKVGDASVGTIFELHPSIRQRFGLPTRAAASTVDLDRLLALPPVTTVAKALPAHPPVAYDVTLTMDASKPLKALLAKIRTTSELLESVDVADLYSGKPLSDHQYNVTLRCVYRAKDRTLTEEETKKEFAKIEKMVA